MTARRIPRGLVPRLMMGGSLMAATAGGLAAQRADSATVARAAMRQAATLFSQHDTAGAVVAIQRAVAAWPQQGAYLLSLGRMSAHAGRADAASAALARATAMGFGWRLDEAAFANPVVHAALSAQGARAQSVVAPSVRSTNAFTSSDTLLQPEGIAFDSRTGRTFLSSPRKRKVVVIDGAGVARDFATGLDAVFGMTVDTMRRTLWVATSAVKESERYSPADSNRAAIVALDLNDGTVRGHWRLGRDVPHVLGDVVLAPDGSVWATDSRTAGIWRASPSDSSGWATRVAIHSSDFASLQGIAFSPSGDIGWIADWTTGLYRVDIARGAVTPVDGDPSMFTLGIDGLYRESARTLIAIQNGITPMRVVRLHLDAGGHRLERIEVLERGMAEGAEPTLGVVVGGELLYVAGGVRRLAL